MNQIVKSLAETETVAGDVVAHLSKLSHDRAVVVGLYGDLGAGKTTFTQAVARALGISETVTSPTFVIEKVYELDSRRGFKRFIHIDAYRLNSGDELKKLRFEEIESDPANLIFIEWPERVREILPAALHKLHFLFLDEQSREITIEYHA